MAFSSVDKVCNFFSQVGSSANICRGGYGRWLGKLSERGHQATWAWVSKERAAAILEQAAAAEEIEAAEEPIHSEFQLQNSIVGKKNFITQSERTKQT